MSNLLKGVEAVLSMDELATKYGDNLLRMCFVYLKDVHLAEDAAQDTLLRAYRSYVKFKGDSSEKTWMMRIAINVCKNYLRRPWWKHTDCSEILAEIPAPDGCEANDDSVIVEVMKLSAKYKEVILLFYYQELKIKEIAQALKLPEGTVSVRLKRAREILKNNLKGWNYDDQEYKEYYGREAFNPEI